MQQQLKPPEGIKRERLNNSSAGKLIRQFLDSGLLEENDLGNPDVVELVNNTETWVVSDLEVGDEVFIIDTIDPKKLVRAIVVYSGEFQILGYNDKTLVSDRGVSIKARHSFAKNTLQRNFERLIPVHRDIIQLEPTERLFRVIKEIPIDSAIRTLALEG